MCWKRSEYYKYNGFKGFSYVGIDLKLCEYLWKTEAKLIIEKSGKIQETLKINQIDEAHRYHSALTFSIISDSVAKARGTNKMSITAEPLHLDFTRSSCALPCNSNAWAQISWQKPSSRALKNIRTMNQFANWVWCLGMVWKESPTKWISFSLPLPHDNEREKDAK